MSMNGPVNKFEKRQISAAQRVAAAKLRTPEEQLARLDSAGFVAKRERLKLAERIAAQNTKRTTKSP